MVTLQAPPAWRRAAPIGAVLAGAALAVAALGLASMLVGAGGTPPGRALDYLLGEPAARADDGLAVTLVSLRWPRTAAAGVVGAALGAAGVLLQAATRNVLAEPGLLGVNAGAALGVVGGIVLAGAETGSAYLGWALLGAVTTSAVVLAVAGGGRAGAAPLRLVLAGVAIGMTGKGLTGVLLLRSANSYDQYRFWVLGSLSGVELAGVVAVLPAVLLGLAVAAGLARPLAALALGDDAARALGHRPGAVRLGAGAAVTLLAAAGVALAGPIAFVGLLAPFAARALTGPRLGAQLALAPLLGAALLLAADIAARVVVRPYEVPASVLVALLGAPLLIRFARSPRLLTLDDR